MRGAFCIAMGVALATTGCKQIFGLDSPTQTDANGGPIATVGFAGPTTLSDEASGVLSIPVLLTEPTDHDVTVRFMVLGGSATDGEDYQIDQRLIVIPVGEVGSTLDIAIVADAVLEDDETIELALISPMGATLGLAQHTVTISATVLPRVNFATTTSTVAEATTLRQITATLDTPSTIPINVMIATSGTATSGTDYSAVASPLTFAAGATSAVVGVTVQNDTLDEDDETVIVTMSSADAAIIGPSAVHTLTITDNDNPPTVSVMPPSATVVEGNVPVTITVQLNTPSGKDITVPFSASGSASAGSDYTYGTTSPVLIPAGMMSTTISVNVMDDTVDEDNETLTTTLGTPTNAQLGASTHALTITDNDVYCVGPAATAFEVCYDRGPTAAVMVSSSLDTGTSPQCAATQPIGWTTTAGQQAACVIWGTDVTIDTSNVSGSRPLVIAASGTITLQNSLNAASVRGFPTSKSGPGAPSSLCAAFVSSPNNSTGGAGGGAGGSFMTQGGNGGMGAIGTNGGTAAAADAAEPMVLRAGCGGQRGGSAAGNSAGNPGLGGGAVYLAAGVGITLQSGSRLNASGCGGTAASFDDVGGSGGGAGGMIRLYAPAITATGALVLANGGGGSEGSSATVGGAPGSDPDPAFPLQPATGGAMASGGGNGGNGFAGITAATVGSMGGNGGGGGGGGGGGLIRSNVALTGATVSAGSVVVQ